MSRRDQIAHGIETIMRSEKPSYVTPTQWRILHLRTKGHSIESVADELGTTPHIANLDEAIAKAAIYKRVATAIDVALTRQN